jgi:hypothetical protein
MRIERFAHLYPMLQESALITERDHATRLTGEILIHFAIILYYPQSPSNS